MSFCASRIVFRELPTLLIGAHKSRTLFAVKYSRHYATHRDTPAYAQPGVTSSSLLSKALDQKQKGVRREDSVGPFQLGPSQPSFGKGSTKKWSELSPKGKGQFLDYDKLFEIPPTFYFSHASDSSYDEPNSHSVRCWSDDCPHLRLNV